MSIVKNYFGKTADGRSISSYTLSRGDISVRIIEFGARVSELIYDGVSVVCGFNDMDSYLRDCDFHGSVVGRYANRISQGKFTLNGTEYTLALNEKKRCHLHGGTRGFSVRTWNFISSSEDDEKDSLTLGYISEDGEEGYPGTLNVRVTYTLTDDNALRLDYDAVCDKDTIINLTNHSYFNLSGVGNTILDHELKYYCDKYVPVDPILIPLGSFADVEGTPFDFRSTKTIGRDIKEDNEQLRAGGGYDHCFVRDNGEKKAFPEPIARLRSPKTGITLDVLTTEAGVLMYTGGYMTYDIPFFGKYPQSVNQALTLECNCAPDSPNQKEFPSCVYKAGEKYTQATIYKFSK